VPSHVSLSLVRPPCARSLTPVSAAWWVVRATATPAALSCRSDPPRFCGVWCGNGVWCERRPSVTFWRPGVIAGQTPARRPPDERRIASSTPALKPSCAATAAKGARAAPDGGAAAQRRGPKPAPNQPQTSPAGSAQTYTRCGADSRTCATGVGPSVGCHRYRRREPAEARRRQAGGGARVARRPQEAGQVNKRLSLSNLAAVR
jgi:hypothetical protein